MKKLYFMISFIALTCFVQAIDFPANAKWISINNGELPKNSWIAFRGEVDLKNQDIAEIEALIAVDSKYWLWVNDQMVVFEGGLKRGPKPGETYFDRVSLEKYLVPGKNTIAVLVWYFGKHGFNHENSGKGAMLFSLQSKLNKVGHDVDWKARVHPAFGQTGEPRPNYRLPEANIHFDARKDLNFWAYKSFDDSAWEKPGPIALAGDKPFGKLWERPIPRWHNSGLVNYTDTETEQTANGTVVKAHMQKNLSITPYLKVKSAAGKFIDIRTDNYKGGGEYNVRTEYVTCDGVQEFETYGYMNGHYVVYTLPEGVEVLELKYRETRYNAEIVGHFSCNDPFYNSLWEKAMNTMNVNMRDAIQDPDRERAQWWGDVVIILGEILYTLDDNGKLAIDKAISNLVEWQKPDGVLFSPVPAGNWDKELPGQMLASVGEYGFWNYYYFTGNKATINYVYPHVKKYMDLWELNDNGLVKHRKGGWTWLDWGNQIDSALIYNTWYYMALKGASKMAGLENDESYKKACLAKMEKVKTAFNREFWDGQGYRSENYKTNYDDRGNGLAIVAGLAETDKWPGITKVLQENFNASPYTEKYILEALFKMNRDDLAQERMKTRYRKMVNSELTTLWEGWGIGVEGYGGGTYNHGWSGGPLTLMMQHMAGISPLKPGWDAYQIKPQMGTLNTINCTVPTPHGKIEVVMNKTNESFELNLTAPPNIPGSILIPIFFNTNHIELNGLKLDKDFKNLPNGFKKIDVKKDEIVFSVSGRNKLNVRIFQ